ncbi:MAG TPA: adenylate/guanylate cyclase domain-containing protein, partial [Anaerolineales bacterium]|nr:adenylate/guanylate cyclase domain-containing protein [Anaerolineales bacterium]
GPIALRSVKNPRYCTGCHFFTTQFPGGAEIELAMLFVDVRGSTTMAETMNNTEFSHLMNRFYEATINVLVQADAFIDKLVGDEVTALFLPGYAGKDHARKAVQAGRNYYAPQAMGSRAVHGCPLVSGYIPARRGWDPLQGRAGVPPISPRWATM